MKDKRQGLKRHSIYRKNALPPEKRDDTLSREQLVAKAESEVSAWLTTRSENGRLAGLTFNTVTDPALAVPLL